MGFETYVVETINQMNLLLVRSDTHSKQRQDYLLEAAVLGCRTLKQLSGDTGFSSTVEEFADVRIIKGFLERASDDYKRRESEKVDQFRTIIENSDCFATFLDLELEVMVKAGLSVDIVDSLIKSSRESIEDVQKRAKPASEVIETVRLLRDRACLLSDDLINEAKDEDRWEGVKERIKKVILGLGGVALIGLNASSLAASVGITAAGSAVSAALGAVFITSAAADIAKTLRAAK
jgi:hypothetical protein